MMVWVVLLLRGVLLGCFSYGGAEVATALSSLDQGKKIWTEFVEAVLKN